MYESDDYQDHFEDTSDLFGDEAAEEAWQWAIDAHDDLRDEGFLQ